MHGLIHSVMLYRNPDAQGNCAPAHRDSQRRAAVPCACCTTLHGACACCCDNIPSSRFTTHSPRGLRCQPCGAASPPTGCATRQMRRGARRSAHRWSVGKSPVALAAGRSPDNTVYTEALISGRPVSGSRQQPLRVARHPSLVHATPDSYRLPEWLACDDVSAYGAYGELSLLDQNRY